MANISDHISLYNIPPFGRCHTTRYPATGAATAANKGKFIPEGYQLYLSMVVGYPEVTPTAKTPRRENVETWL